jgi:lipid A disaccharide synthetase
VVIAAADAVLTVSGTATLECLLAERRLVPELPQGEVRAERLGPEVLRMMDGTEDVLRLKGELAAIKRTLRGDASRTAADAVLGLIGP